MKGAPGVLRIGHREGIAIIEIEDASNRCRAEIPTQDFWDLLEKFWEGMDGDGVTEDLDVHQC